MTIHRSVIRSPMYRCNMAPAEPGGDAQAEAMSSMMMPMLLLLGMMVLLMINPGIRVVLSSSAGSVLEPMLPFHQDYFVPTVFIVGTSIMIVNTIIRSFFMDPLQQAHFSHRNRQIGKQLREARVARDTARADKMQRMQLEMMPEQMKMQSSMMKPMVFTMVFIIAIFSWMAESVGEFKVGFVSHLDCIFAIVTAQDPKVLGFKVLGGPVEEVEIFIDQQDGLLLGGGGHK